VQLRNVLLTCSGGEIPVRLQSTHSPDVSGDVCAHNIPVMADAVHFKQDSLCKDDQWSLSSTFYFF